METSSATFAESGSSAASHPFVAPLSPAEELSEDSSCPSASENATATTAPALREQLAAWNRLANAGDPAAMQELRAFLDEHPEGPAFVGDCGRLALGELIRLLSQGDSLAAEMLRRQAATLREQLGHAVASPLEQLAIERVVLAHMHSCRSDIEAAAANLTPAQRATVAKQQEAHQRRLTNASKMLHTVRQAEQTLALQREQAELRRSLQLEKQRATTDAQPASSPWSAPRHGQERTVTGDPLSVPSPEVFAA